MLESPGCAHNEIDSGCIYNTCRTKREGICTLFILSPPVYASRFVQISYTSGLRVLRVFCLSSLRLLSVTCIVTCIVYYIDIILILAVLLLYKDYIFVYSSYILFISLFLSPFSLLILLLVQLVSCYLKAS